ncbi:MAG: AAA family ATPase [Myxococcaceae bacterium]|nr:AAA family ATPase [Myxococcaceae bacterium]
MRFERIDIIRFGALEGVSLDLSNPSPGLHVIYGENEAGKTTLRRAISALLFGIPERTADDFRFERRELRLGATLRLSDGSVVSFLRKKARKGDLLDLEERPVRIAWLEAFARDVGPQRFLSEWSLDHEQLGEGGRELAEGRGRVGETLLSAGLGGRPVSRLLEALGQEAGELFRPNAQSPKVNALLRRIAELRAELHARCLSPREVEEKNRRLGELERQREEIRSKRDEAQRTLQRLDRIERARPSLGRRARLREQLAELALVPRLGADFGVRRIDAQKAADSAAAALEKATRELAELDERLRSIHVDAQVLAAAAELEALAARIEVFTSNQTELKKLAQAISDAERSVAEEARALGMEEPALVALTRGPWQRHDANVRDLADRFAGALPECAQLEQEVRDAERQLAVLEQRAADLPAPHDVSALEHAYAALVADGPPDRRWAKLRSAAEEAELAARRAFEGLGRWVQSRADLERAVLPSLEELEAHAEALAVVPDEAAVRTAQAELDRRRAELRRLQAGGAIPTEAALDEARRRRDQGWKLVRDRLEGKSSLPEEEQRFAGSAPLADAYEAAVVEADRIADGLRENARRVEKYAQLCERIEEAEQALQAAQQALERDRQRLSRAEAAWRASWAPFGMEPASPKVMRAWLGRAEEVRRLLHQAAASRRELVQTEADLRTLAAPVAAALGWPEPALEDLAKLVLEAETRLQSARAMAAERKHVEAALAEARHTLATKTSLLERAWTRRTELERSREALAVALGLPGDATVEELRRVIARVGEVAGRLRQLDRDRMRRAELLARSDDFAAAVRRAAARLGLAEADRAGVEVLAHTLRDRLKAARAAEQERRQMEALRAQAQRARDEAAASGATAHKALARLCAEAGTDDPSVLAGLQEQNDRRRELEQLLRECEDALIAQAPDGDIEALAAEVASLPAEGASALRSKTEETLRACNDRYTELTREVALLEAALGAIHGSDDAAEKNAELQSALAQLHEHAAEWLRLKYAESLLRRAMERYREEHQNPVLRRAGELFARLTLGRYPAIGISAEEEEPVLQAVRVVYGRKEYVGTDQMSDGTRDQLFLALRIAVIEQELAAREPLPLIVDDILIQLSDDRARAALEVLAELAEKTQVLLFTHHRRIAELAQWLMAPQIHVHELTAPAPGGLRVAQLAG